MNQSIVSRAAIGCSGLKNHYRALAAKIEGVVSPHHFTEFLTLVVHELAWGLTIDLSLIARDIADPELSKLGKFETIDALKRALKPLAEAANYKAITHPDWSLLAGRLDMQRINLTVPETLSEMLDVNKTIWRSGPEYDYYDFCKGHAQVLEAMIDPLRDYSFYYFGLKTLEKSYLMRVIDQDTQHLLETPQRMYLRIATALWMPNLEMIKEYYDLMSLGYFTHASPTMFHAGITKGSLASCFLLSMSDDLEKIYKCLGQCAMISKSAGGIGLDISNIRHTGISHFGPSSGIVPMLKVFDASMRYVDQGGRRKGSATIFLQPWHIDFPDFLELKRQNGMEERRARDLFYAVWNCDIFMDRVKADAEWTMFCPKFAPKLTDTYGAEFEKWYLHYEQELPKLQDNNRFVRKMPARQVWTVLLTSQIETGMPFMTNKDTANYTSNQQNLGLIRSSNLCVEIVEVTDENTISSCNLASIALDEFVVGGVFDHAKLGYVTRLIVRGLNRVIDHTFYPLPEKDARDQITSPGPIARTNLDYRPLGLGVQALADTFLKMGLAWTDPEARELNKQIFATIYYNALDESVELAKVDGVYKGFYGSPASKGLLKPDLFAAECARKQTRLGQEAPPAPTLSTRFDWDALRSKVRMYGLRNSLLIALMPTASSAQIRYKNESFEPFTTNIYIRNVLSGSHLIVNRYMVADLERMGMWTKPVINNIIKNQGSLMHISADLIPAIHATQFARLQAKCATAFELPQKLLVNMAIDRQMYVCQSQSLNIHIKQPNFKQLTSLHFYAWENGLTTGMYYLRSAAAAEAVQFTVDTEAPKPKTVVCTDEVCVSCSS